ERFLIGSRLITKVEHPDAALKTRNSTEPTLSRSWVSPTPPTVSEWWTLFPQIFELESAILKA
ncbi:hypothetical protein NDU88_006088, partial [Pleurodeles waltl]